MEKKIGWQYFVSWISWFFTACSFLLFCGLAYEYYQIKQCIGDLARVRIAYQDRLQALDSLVTNKISSEEQSDFFESDTSNAMDDLFIPLNRNPLYLQSSAYDLFKRENIEGLFAHVSKEWDMYEGYISHRSSTSIEGKRKVQRRPVKGVVARAKSRGNSFLEWPIPLDSFWLSSPFGQRKNRDGSIGFYYGIDLAALKGTRVRAAADGIVEQAGYARGYGNVVKVKHTQRISTRYAHLDSVNVKVGQRVLRGDLLGRVGETGFVRKRTKDGSHLHFEVCDGGKRVNPLPLLSIM